MTEEWRMPAKEEMVDDARSPHRLAALITGTNARTMRITLVKLLSMVQPTVHRNIVMQYELPRPGVAALLTSTAPVPMMPP